MGYWRLPSPPLLGGATNLYNAPGRLQDSSEDCHPDITKIHAVLTDQLCADSLSHSRSVQPRALEEAPVFISALHGGPSYPCRLAIYRRLCLRPVPSWRSSALCILKDRSVLEGKVVKAVHASGSGFSVSVAIASTRVERPSPAILPRRCTMVGEPSSPIPVTIIASAAAITA